MSLRAEPIQAALEPGLRSLYLARRAHALAARSGGRRLSFALERPRGSVPRFSLPIVDEAAPRFSDSLRLAERVLKLILWQRGACGVFIAGSPVVAAQLAGAYRPGGARAFDAEFFGRVYEKPLPRIPT